MSRDKDGNYVNEKGMTIKISDYKDDSGAKIDFYDKSPRETNHKSIHIHVNNDGSYNTEDNVNGSIEKSSGSCYLTSACMNYFQDKFDDNCYELRVLRWFRDNFVSKEDIEHYYTIAPIIVYAINNELNSNIVYNYIYDNIVDACVTAIENGSYEFAYNRYKNTVLSLEATFVKPFPEEKFVKILSNKF